MRAGGAEHYQRETDGFMKITFNREPRLCANSACDVWFTPAHPSQKYHEPRCKNDVNNDKNRIRYNDNNPIEERMCHLDTCGVRFVPNRRDQRFHSDQCRTRHNHNNQNLRRRQQRANIASGVPTRKRKYHIDIDPYHRTNTERMRYDGEERRMKLMTIPTKLTHGTPSQEGSTDTLSWQDTLDLMFPYTDAELRDMGDAHPD